MDLYVNTNVEASLKKEFSAFKENPYPGVPRLELHQIHNSHLLCMVLNLIQFN